MSLIEVLKQNNYVRIPLSRSVTGHFHTNGTFGDRRISVLVDTGASDTVFNFGLAAEMKLPLSKLSAFGGGAGAAQLEIFQTEKARFVLGEFELKVSKFLTMDLAHVNEALARRESAPIDAVLGADVLDAHQAVIDYASSSLFLKIL